MVLKNVKKKKEKRKQKSIGEFEEELVKKRCFPQKFNKKQEKEII